MSPAGSVTSLEIFSIFGMVDMKIEDLDSAIGT
jgi:hypothetical protein